jgi:hypothetical protein
MSSRQSQAMTLSYLHTSDALFDRLIQDPSKVLRNDDKPKDEPAPTEREIRLSKKKHEKDVRKLEKEMDAMTDPKLLDDGREHQQGKYNITAQRSLLVDTADMLKVSRRELGHSPRAAVVASRVYYSRRSLTVTYLSSTCGRPNPDHSHLLRARWSSPTTLSLCSVAGRLE